MGGTNVERENLLSAEDLGATSGAEDVEALGRVVVVPKASRRSLWRKRAAVIAGVSGVCVAMAVVGSAKRGPAVLRTAAKTGGNMKLSEQPCDLPGGEVADPCKPPSLDTMTKKDPSASDAAGDEQCSAAGEDCSSSRCCSAAGMQCFAQDDSYAECRATCIPGPDPIFGNGKSWSCEKLGERQEGEAPVCSEAGEDCTSSKCCKGPGMTCFEKIPGEYAQCKASCTPGLDLYDSAPGVWTCKALGPKAPAVASWVAEQCSAAGADCRKTKCCSEPDHQCYLRDEFWGQCKPSCEKGTNPDEPWSTQKWGCEELGSRTPVAAPKPDAAPAPGAKLADWVATTCAKDGEDCSASECCSGPGMQCFEKNANVSLCKASCTPGPDLFDKDAKPWTCKAKGPLTPGSPNTKPGQNVSEWVEDNCTASGAGCLDSRCCKEAGYQCFSKDDGWAACLQDCTPGQNRSAFGDIDSKPWACDQLGMRTPRPWKHPSLFCFNVIRATCYEPDLVRDQLAKSVGIFSCEEFAVFSSDKYTGCDTTWYTPPDCQATPMPLVSIHLGVGPQGSVDTIPFEPAYVGTSMDHTAGNTQLFLNVWQKVLESGKHLYADWTIKVDPDAVMLAHRVRSILKEYTGSNSYIVNCDKPGMAPMMFGSVEMYSNKAMATFFARKQECLDGLGWKAWGDDYFMGKCLDMLGVKRTNQFSIVSDGVCKGVNCGDPNAAVFHPMKASAAWMQCLDQAEAAR